jgi:hypothetical protein
MSENRVAVIQADRESGEAICLDHSQHGLPGGDGNVVSRGHERIHERTHRIVMTNPRSTREQDPHDTTILARFRLERVARGAGAGSERVRC